MTLMIQTHLQEVTDLEIVIGKVKRLKIVKLSIGRSYIGVTVAIVYQCQLLLNVFAAARYKNLKTRKVMLPQQ